MLHDRGINPNRLVDPDGDDDDEEEGKEAMSREEKEANDLLDALTKPRVELSCVFYSDDKNANAMMNVGVPKVRGFEERSDEALRIPPLLASLVANTVLTS